MRRWLTLVLGVAALVGAGAMAPANADQDAPIGRLGQTLRVVTDTIIADVTVHDVLPCEEPPGWTWTGTPRWRAQGAPWRAGVTVHAIRVPNPHQLAISFTFDGVTPNADAYVSKHTEAPDQLETALANSPAGSTVSGGVYWDVYRDLVTNVVLLDPKTGAHLAQWNL